VAPINKKRVVPVVVVGLAVVVVAYWAIRKATAKPGPLTASGTLEAVEVDVAPVISGRIVSVNYDDGDAVAKGAVLATLDTGQLDAALAAADASARAARDRAASARAALDAAEDNFRRIKAAYPGGGISAAEYERAASSRDRAQADYANAVSSAAQTEAGREQTKVQRGETDLYAPIAGVVLSRNLEPGEVAGPSLPVVTMADLSVLELYVYIPEAEIGRVRLGDAVAIQVDSYRGENFAGRVKAVANRTAFTPRNVESKEDRVTLVFKVTVTVPNAGGRLKPGMPADVVFVNAIAGAAKGK